MSKRIKNVDADGKPIKSGDRVEFNGSKLMGQYWIEHGVMRYDPSRNKWFFVGAESTHGAVVDWQPGKRIFKYYRVLDKKEVCKHEWRITYYGTECKLCKLFYPSGSEPWLPLDYTPHNPSDHALPYEPKDLGDDVERIGE